MEAIAESGVEGAQSPSPHTNFMHDIITQLLQPIYCLIVGLVVDSELLQLQGVL